MKRKTKNPALLFIMTMFAFFGMLSANASDVEQQGSYLSGNGTMPLVVNAERQTFTNQIVNVDNEEFRNLSTDADGGALAINNIPTLGESTISNSKFISNKAIGYSGADSGAISIQNGVFVLTNNEFKSNKAMFGGAIYAYTGNLKGVQVAIQDCTFDANSALTGGAIGQFASRKLWETGGMTITNTKFSNNKATEADDTVDGGVAMFIGAEAVTSINGSVFSNNTSSMNGGAIVTRDSSAMNSNGKIDITSTSFVGNIADKKGGAIDNYFYNSQANSGYVTITDSLFEENQAADGGAIYNHGELDTAGNMGSMKFINTSFKNNSATEYGGAIFNAGTMDISDGAEFIGNSAYKKGGAIYNSGTMTLGNDISFTGNTTTWDGTAGSGSDMDANGGAIWNSGNMTLGNNVTFTDNHASSATTSGDGHGSDIYNVSGTITIGDNLLITRTDNYPDYAHDCAIFANAGTINIGNNATISNVGEAIVTSGTSIINIGNNLNINNVRNGIASWGKEVNIGNNATFENIIGSARVFQTVTDTGLFTFGDGLVVKNNMTASFGNIYNESYNTSMTFKGKADFINNSAQIDNAGVFQNWGAVYFNGVTTFEGNTAKGVAGAYRNRGERSKTVFDSEANFTNNGSLGNAGAMYNQGALTFNDKAVFTGNIAGIMYEFVENEKGFFVDSEDESIRYSWVATGLNPVKDSDGGAIYNKSLDGVTGVVTFNRDATFTNNQAGGNGGAIYNAGTIKFNSNATFENNTASNGGAIYNDSSAVSLVLNGASFTSNTAKAKGGALYNGNSARVLTVENAQFTNNTAGENGGAVYNSGLLKIKDSTFSGNTANGENNDIYNIAQLTLSGTVKLDGGITGTGSTQIESGADVDNSNGTLAQESVSVESGAKLTQDVSKIDVEQSIVNSGTVSLTGNGELNSNFTGTGTIEIKTNDTIILNNTAYLGSNVMNVVSGELAIGSNVTTISNKLTFGDAKLNLINGVSNTVSDLNVLEDSVLNIEIDFNDKIETSNPSEHHNVQISKIDLSGLTSSSALSTVTTTLGNDLSIALDAQFVGNSDVNYVSLVKSGSEATLNASDCFLYDAIVDTAQERVYQMDAEETITTSNMTGTLVINGNGQTITSDDTDLGGGINIVETPNGSSLSIIDANVDSIKVNDDNKGALNVQGSSTLVVVAKNTDVTIANTIGNTVNNAIYLDDAVSGQAEAQLIAMDGKSLTVQDDIRSNNVNNSVELLGDGSIYLNGTLDPLTINTSALNVYRNGYDEDITWNLNGGTVHYSNDAYLYEASHHGSTLLNTLNFNGGALDLMNGAVNTINLAALQISADSRLFVDVDLANKTIDKFSAPVTVLGGKLNVAGMQILSETSREETEINFTSDAALKGNVTTSVTEVASPVYKYQVEYLSGSGNFKFVRSSFNPAVFSSAVAMQGSYLSQLANYDVAMGNLDQQMLMTKEQRFAWKYGNKYAANDQTNPQVYSPLFTREQQSGVWFRPYTTFERVDLFNGPEVSNVMYGTLVGGDSPMMELGNDWDAQYSAYVGYNGSHQAFVGNSIYQNGGLVGLTGALYKGNFFQALTANVGASVANIDTSFGKNDLTMLSTGIASKTGYNWELAKGKFIIQPSWQMSYTFVSPMNNYSMGNVRIKNDSLHAIQLAPGLKFIGNLPHGWQPYINLRMLWNIIDDTKVKANNVNLPETSVKPYFEYGLGLQKTVGETFTGFGQMMFRNGGRTGVAFTLGFRWALGKDAQK